MAGLVLKVIQIGMGLAEMEVVMEVAMEEEVFEATDEVAKKD